jgi:Tol biopolymer transport system component
MKHTRSQPQSGSTTISKRASRALAAQSAALVRRGLRDLARDSNWLIKKLFTRRMNELVISPTGQVCATSYDARASRARISIFDIELSVPAFNLDVPYDHPPEKPAERASFAWSPDGRYVVAASPDGSQELHLLDVQARSHVRLLNSFEQAPDSLTWASSGNHFAASFAAGDFSSIRVWRKASDRELSLGRADGEIAVADWIAARPGSESAEDAGSFRNYGALALSPGDEWLAVVAEIDGDWADDYLLLTRLPSLRLADIHAGQGHITDVSWSRDSQQLVYCASGQAFRLKLESREASPLPFAAELFRCHPTLPIAGCFASWLKNSAKGRLFVANLDDGTVIDECPAEGVADIRWSGDGTKLYAVSQDGLAYAFEASI